MRKRLLTAIIFLTVISSALAPITAGAQQKEPTLRSILLEQFRNTWNKQDWFVPVAQSVEGLTAKQAMWKPADSSHSVGELAYHIMYWNREQLDKFYDRKPAPFSGNNNETFTAFTEATWATTVEQLNKVMADWEKAIETADEAKLKKWASAIDHVNTHTAYHTGQILYIRKLAGNWDPNKGVK
ncbi:MAG TPA: DinB family protein [Puia sp.]|nr:DinB family protein [Puia sp.]